MTQKKSARFLVHISVFSINVELHFAHVKQSDVAREAAAHLVVFLDAREQLVYK